MGDETLLAEIERREMRKKIIEWVSECIPSEHKGIVYQEIGDLLDRLCPI